MGEPLPPCTGSRPSLSYAAVEEAFRSALKQSDAGCGAAIQPVGAQCPADVGRPRSFTAQWRGPNRLLGHAPESAASRGKWRVGRRGDGGAGGGMGKAGGGLHFFCTAFCAVAGLGVSPSHRPDPRVGGVARGRRPATRDPRPRPKSVTRDPRPRATRALSGSQPPDSGAPRGARHSHTMHSTSCTNYVRKQYAMHKQYTMHKLCEENQCL